MCLLDTAACDASPAPTSPPGAPELRLCGAGGQVGAPGWTVRSSACGDDEEADCRVMVQSLKLVKQSEDGPSVGAERIRMRGTLAKLQEVVL